MRWSACDAHGTEQGTWKGTERSTFLLPAGKGRASQGGGGGMAVENGRPGRGPCRQCTAVGEVGRAD